MRGDIIARLRWIVEEAKCDCPICKTCSQAMAEIERLRAIGDALANVLRSGSDLAAANALDAWEEVRRG